MEKPKNEKIIAIETSGKMFSIALAEMNRESSDPSDSMRIKGELFLDVGLRHSEILKESCVSLMQKVGWQKGDLTCAVVCIGPGSFTGIRVGVSFARGLAQFLKIPLIGVPVFEVMAMGLSQCALPLSGEFKVCVLIESIQNQFFAGFFKSGSVRPNETYKVLTLDQLFLKIKKGRKTILAGEGFLRRKDEIESKFRGCGVKVPLQAHYPQARFLALAAAEKIKKNRNYSWRKVVPFYLRPPLVVERLK